MKPLKVYTINTFKGSKQVVAIVAARSGAEARRLLNVHFGSITPYEWKNHSSVTANTMQVNTAMSDPGKVFAKSMDDSFKDNVPYVEVR